MSKHDEGLQNFADARQGEVNAELDKLFNKILVLAGQLAEQQDVTFTDIQLAVNTEVEQFNSATAATIVGLAAVASTSLNKAKDINPKAEFSQSDIAKIDGFVSAISLEFTDFTKTKATEISSSIYQQILAGATKQEIVDSVKKTLASSGLGNQNLRGFKTLITTRVFELESFVTKLLVEKEGVTEWKYVGGLIETSRDWCVKHDGLTLTKEEIDQWRNSSWTGKKEGDPFVVRGGWNCRHHWQPVSPGKK